MNTLVIDTSSRQSIIAIKTAQKELFCVLENNKPQSECLLVKIDEMLTMLGVDVQQLTTIGVVVGPGSFTGLRIAIAIAKGFVCSNPNIKCVAVNTFELLSNSIQDDNCYLCLSSGNNEPYYADKCNGNFSFGYIEQTALQELSNQNHKKIYSFVGEFNDENYYYVEKTPQTLLNVVLNKIDKNDYAELSELAPVYIKVSQAEKELRTLVKDHIEIRDVILVSDLVEIENECFAEDKWTEKTFLEELALSDRKYFMAYYKGKAIGYVGLWVTGEDLNLLKIGVLPEFRQLGIASKLLSKAFDFKTQKKLTKFFLEVDEQNEPAKKLY